MNEASVLFKKVIDATSDYVKRRVDLSFEISNRIDYLLKERGMTQKEFARKMGKTEAEVSRWLSGMHNFTLATLAKISAELEADIIKVC